MLKTERMKQVVIAGAEAHQRTVIDALHDLRAVHIEEHEPASGDFFQTGRPLAEGEAVAKSLLRARGLQKSLGLDDEEPTYTLDSTAAAKEKVASISQLVSSLVKEQADLEEDLKALESERAKLARLAPLGLRLEVLGGFKSLRTFVGSVSGDAKAAVFGVTKKAEVITASDSRGDLVAAFVPHEQAEAVEQALAQLRFNPIEVPEGEGPVDTVVGQTTTRIGKIGSRMEEIAQRLAKHREEHGPELLAAIASLEEASEKASIPLAFAAGPTSFVVSGYVPARRQAEAEKALQAATGHRMLIYEPQTRRA